VMAEVVHRAMKWNSFDPPIHSPGVPCGPPLILRDASSPHAVDYEWLVDSNERTLAASQFACYSEPPRVVLEVVVRLRRYLRHNYLTDCVRVENCGRSANHVGFKQLAIRDT